MILDLLQINNLRNLKSARFKFDPHINIIVGPNGSGKTSLLESIYLLGSGHSFRTREIAPLVSTNSDCLTVFARTQDEQSISIQKSRSSPTKVRLNGYLCQAASELAYFLPCQIFYQDLFQIIDAGPSVRRRLLDWGLFHVEHSYHPILKEYYRALKQRNSLLKQQAKESLFEPWNVILEELATKLDHYRANYFIQLEKEFKKILSQLSELNCTLSYYKGWDRRKTDKSLALILTEAYKSDLQRQYTQYGAHQADLLIHTEDQTIKDFLSRGQQKLILIALKLAQAALLKQSVIYLCDDLCAELDIQHLERLFFLISILKGQFFITAVNQESIPNSFFAQQHILLKLGNE